MMLKHSHVWFAVAPTTPGLRMTWLRESPCTMPLKTFTGTVENPSTALDGPSVELADWCGKANSFPEPQSTACRRPPRDTRASPMQWHALTRRRGEGGSAPHTAWALHPPSPSRARRLLIALGSTGTDIARGGRQVQFGTGEGSCNSSTLCRIDLLLLNLQQKVLRQGMLPDGHQVRRRRRALPLDVLALRTSTDVHHPEHAWQQGPLGPIRWVRHHRLLELPVPVPKCCV